MEVKSEELEAKYESSPQTINVQQLLSLVQQQKQEIEFKNQHILQQNLFIRCLQNQYSLLLQQMEDNPASFMKNFHIFKYKNGIPSPDTENLEKLSLQEVVKKFVASLTAWDTRKSYTEWFSQLFDQDLLQAQMTLAEFRNLDAKDVLHRVHEKYKVKRGVDTPFEDAPDFTKRLRAAMLKKFYIFINPEMEDFFPGTVARWRKSRRKLQRPKTISSNLTPEQKNIFLQTVKSFSYKGFLFAYLIFVAGVNIGHVLNLRIENLDFDRRRVSFQKKLGLYDTISVVLPEDLVINLKEYLGDRKHGYVFIKHNTDQSYNIQMSKGEINKIFAFAWDLIKANKAF